MKKKQIEMIVLSPTQPEATKLTMDDVWGTFDDDNHKLISRGMIVAQGYGGGWIDGSTGPAAYEKWKAAIQVSDICPVWKDKLPYKSVTVICKKAQQSEVEYWLEYVHGGGSVEKWQELPFGKVAIRSNYKCW